MPTAAEYEVILKALGGDKVVQEFLKVENAAKKTGTAAKASTKDALMGFGDLHAILGKIQGVLGGIGVAISAGAFINFIKAGMDAGAAIAHMADNVGMSVQNVQALEFAFKRAGVEEGVFNTVTARLAQKLQQLKDGDPKLAEMFDKIGLHAKDFGDDTGRNLVKVAQGMERLGDGTHKTALILELLGARAGKTLNAALHEIAGGMEEVTARATEAGAITSEQTIRKVEEAHRATEALASAWKTLGINIAAAMANVIPAIKSERQAEADIANMELLEAGKQLRFLQDAAARHKGPLSAAQQGYLDAAQARYDLAKQQMDYALRAELPETTVTAVGPKKPGDTGGAARGRANTLLRDQEALEKARAERSIQILKDEYDQKRITVDQYYDGLERAAKAEMEAEQAEIEASKGTWDAYQAAAVKYETRMAALTNQRTDAVKKLREEENKRGEEQTKAVAEANQRAFAESYAGRLQAALQDLGQSAQGIVESGLAQFFESAATGAQSLGDVARNLVGDFARLASQIAALGIMRSILGGGGDVASNFILGGGSVLHRAEGGLISGPGTGTSDSIPAMLSAGEYVVPAAAVSRPGVLAGLEGLRSMARLGLRSYGGPGHFASGGLVSGAGRSSTTLNGQLTVSLSEGLSGHLEGDAAARSLIKVVGRNRHAFNAALGG